MNLGSRSIVALVGVPALIGGLLTSTAATAQTPQPVERVAASSDAAVPRLGKVDQARFTLVDPIANERAVDIARQSTPIKPVEIMFRSGNWVGGIVVGGFDKSASVLIENFLADSRAASDPRAIVSIGASRDAVVDGFDGLDGEVSFRSQGLQTSGEDRAGTARGGNAGSLVPPCDDCDIRINAESDDPGVPVRGRLLRVRQQGIIEGTSHTIRGLGNTGYPATLHVVAMTNAQSGTIKPDYIYEHDYKIKDNGYVARTSAYDWSTNLPGAYRDTRARGLEGGDDDLDFTVGSVFTWLLDSSVVYRIDTHVAAGSVSRSTAKLTASVIPNDGGFSATDAATSDGCAFVVNPYSYPDPASTVPQPTTSGNLAWCGGIGNFVVPSAVKNISLVSLEPFRVKFDSTCRNWVTGAGFTAC